VSTLDPGELAGLLARCALKDQRAFAELYRLTAAKLFGVVARIVRRDDWAEEVLQESYVSVWTHAVEYTQAKSAPMTWMTSIARNRALDWLRRPRLEATGEEYEPVIANFADESPHALERLAHATEAATVRRCLDALEGIQRQVIALAYFHGLTHSELAAHLSQPLGSVKTWVRRGLERLRGCLAAGG